MKRFLENLKDIAARIILPAVLAVLITALLAAVIWLTYLTTDSSIITITGVVLAAGAIVASFWMK